MLLHSTENFTYEYRFAENLEDYIAELVQTSGIKHG